MAKETKDKKVECIVDWNFANERNAPGKEDEPNNIPIRLNSGDMVWITPGKKTLLTEEVIDKLRTRAYRIYKKTKEGGKGFDEVFKKDIAEDPHDAAPDEYVDIPRFRVMFVNEADRSLMDELTKIAKENEALKKELAKKSEGTDSTDEE